jgi:light-regulated signal transduction histidine kinase (bacteriophytochrome)
MIMNKFGIGETGILSICMILIAAIFVVDASTPSGYSACFLYILPVFICLGLPNDRTVYGLALIATVLTIIAVPFEPSGTLSIDLFNRPIAIAGIWVVVSLGIQRRKFERDIEKKACELARSNVELQQFAYIVSHDFKGPLATTIGNLALLEKQYAGKVMDEKAQQFVRNTIQSEERMSRLIDDLLELSKVDSKGKPFEKVNMNEVLSLVEQNLDRALKESNATITSDPLPTVMADQVQIMGLLQNLIANAIKFRRPGEPPRIHVSATSTDSEWTFSVADNGIGIPEEQQERIFQMFQRLHTEQEYPGTGIGLAISKKIAQRHGGRIWVESEEGKGATFYFTIPVQS